MARNQIYDDGYKLSVICSDPTTPSAGDAVRFGALTGVALTDEGGGGNASGYTTVDFGPGVWDLPVKGESGAIAVGDALFYDDAIDGVNNDSANGYFFGFALETVGNGATTTIQVLHVPSPGAGTLGAGTVGAANLASNAVETAKIAAAAVTKTKLAGGFSKVSLIAGGVAGDHTVTDMAVGDELVFVAHISTAASVATIADLTSEFTVAAGKVTNAGGTDTTDDQLMIFWTDLT